MSVYWVGDNWEYRRVSCQCMGWGVVGSRGGFVSVYGMGDNWEQRIVYVIVWAGG